MTLDGYIAGPNQSVEKPLGEGGDHIHDWVPLKTSEKCTAIRRRNTGIMTTCFEAFANVGATRWAATCSEASR
jgi:hypothetical protein